MPQSDLPLSRSKGNLFLVSGLILFLELACIRWFPAHVLLLTFFTNCVLLSCFLGISVGCLVASHRQNYIRWTAPALILGILCAHGAELLPKLEKMIEVGDQSQVVYFGAERYNDPTKFFIPLEVLCGFFFIVIAVAMVGLGQELGRALARVPGRVEAYTIDIAGSLAGISLFAFCSWVQLSPPFWFTAIALGLGYLLLSPNASEGGPKLAGTGRYVTGVALAAMVVLASWRSGNYGFDKRVPGETFWSPYYRIDYSSPPARNISVNLIGHQKMHALGILPEYTFPHMIRRDMQRLAGNDAPPYEDMLIIGAGSGNDVSRALQFGVKHVDAVEIDPVIYKLGKKDHPAHPYDDPRVTVHNDDGRNFIRKTDKKYDLIVYALVDSLVLHSSYSNIRLESYLFTKEAFEDVQRHLKPGGIFVTYNYFRQGWVLSRLDASLKDVFGAAPLVMTLPYRDVVKPDEQFGGFTIFMNGSADTLAPYRAAFAAKGDYWLEAHEATPTSKFNGFVDRPPTGTGDGVSGEQVRKEEDPYWVRVGLAKIVPAPDVGPATDDWPFLYLKKPMIPTLNIRAALVMAGLSIGVLVFFTRRGKSAETDATAARAPRFDTRMFFLGAGFMLVETKAVVRMALLFGSTWITNSLVFFAVLAMILMANVFVLKVKPKSLVPYYAGLLLALLLSVVVPLHFFLGMARGMQVVGSSVLVALPVLFAGVIFAVSFERSSAPDRAFGANIAGAMLGGLAEYASMLVGFQYTGVVAMTFYVLSMIPISAGSSASAEPVANPKTVPPAPAKA